MWRKYLVNCIISSTINYPKQTIKKEINTDNEDYLFSKTMNFGKACALWISVL